LISKGSANFSTDDLELAVKRDYLGVVKLLLQNDSSVEATDVQAVLRLGNILETTPNIQPTCKRLLLH